MIGMLSFFSYRWDAYIYIYIYIWDMKGVYMGYMKYIYIYICIYFLHTYGIGINRITW